MLRCPIVENVTDGDSPPLPRDEVHHLMRPGSPQQWSPIRGTKRRSSGPNWPWRHWSHRRKMRFARTVAIGLVLLILLIITVSRCGSDTTITTATTTTKKEKATTTVKPVVVTAGALPKRMPSGTWDGAATVANGQVILFGGLNTLKQSTVKVWQIDPATGSTQNIAKLAAPRHQSAAAALGNTAFTFGGNTKPGVLDSIDSVTVGDNVVTTLGKLPGPRSEGAAITDPAGPTIYIAGGWNGTDPTNDVLSSVDGVTFQTRATLTEPVRSPAVAAQGDDLWVFGGQWKDVPTGSIQRVNLATGKAEVVARLPQPLTGAMAFTIGDTVYLAGGRTAAGRSNEVRRFDPTTFTFTTVATLPVALSDSGVAVLGNVAYLVGGLTPAPSNQTFTVTVS